MKKQLFNLSLFCCLVIWCTQSTFAQEASHRTCGMEQHMEQLMSNSKFKAKYDARMQLVPLKEDLQILNRTSEGGCPEIITIPVAVHYQGVSTGDMACMIDQAVQSIAQLNADYSGTNADIANWASYASSFPDVDPALSCVEFCLATNDHPSSSSLVDGDFAVTFNESSGDDVPAWSGYINFFVRNIGGGLLGYSPLFGQGNGDGVTINHNTWGIAGSGCSVSPSPPFNLGRTLTHELGHYFGLDHVFNGCGAGDGIADTPASSQESYGCPSLGPGTTTCGSQDMFMNYMDYVDDFCMIMFTPGQIAVVENYATSPGGLLSLANSSETKCGPVVQTPPTASINVGNTTFCPNAEASITFSGAVSGGSLTFSWTVTGDAIDAPVFGESSSVTVNPTSSGTLNVSLFVSNDEGDATAIEELTVTILAEDAEECQATPCDTSSESYDWAFTANLLGVSQDPLCGPSGTSFSTDGGFGGWPIWAGESYELNLIGGFTYTLDICPASAVWDPQITVTAPSGAVDGISTLSDPACSVTFTASESGVYTLFMSSEDDCGTLIQEDAGLLSVTFEDADCASLHCTNGIQDEDEEGIDCGGADCPPCEVLCENPILVDFVTECGNGEGTVTFFVEGGEAPYTASSPAEQTGDNTFSVLVPDGTALSITFDDSSDCDPVELGVSVDCPEICENPIEILNTTTECDSGFGTYTVIVTGGNSGLFEISDPSFEQIGPNGFIADVVDGQVLEFEISDGSVCDPLSISETISCPTICESEIVAEIVASDCGNGSGTVSVMVSGGNGDYSFDPDVFSADGDMYTATFADGDNFLLLINDSSICDPFGLPVVINCPEFCESPLSASGVLDCESNMYTITVSGGVGAISVPGFADMGDGTYTLAVSDGDVVNVVVNDESDICDPVVIIEPIVCQAPPMAQNADFLLAEGTGSLNIDLAALSSDPNDDNLTYEVSQPAEGGSVTVDAATGAAVFTPDVDFLGTVSFAYSVSDGFNAPVSAVITVDVAFDCSVFPALDAQVLVQINAADETFTVYAFVTSGGQPELDGSMYTVTSPDFAVQIPAGEVYTSATMAITNPGTIYEVTISDNVGCGETFEYLLSIPLDVALINFTGEVLTEGNNLKWITASETNNDFFTLYRSSNGIDFEVITEVTGQGTSSIAQNYVYLDKDAPAGISYYRLDQTDFDGTTNTIGYVNLNRGETNLNIVSVYPVPTHNSVELVFNNNQTERVLLNIHDITGKLVYSENVDAQNGNNNIQVSLEAFSTGVYFLSLNNSRGITTQKVVKE